MSPEDDEKATRERYALGPRGKRVTVEAALERAERAEAEASTLRAERDEAVAALRLMENVGCLCAFMEPHQGACESCEARRAVLAKYPEGK